MSVSKWAISGIGLDVNEYIYDLNFLNHEAIMNILEEDTKEIIIEGFEDCAWEIVDDILLKLSKETGVYLSFVGTGYDDKAQYILFESLLPWEMGESEKNLTRDEAENIIVNAVQTLFILPEETIRNKIGYINEGGEG